MKDKIAEEKLCQDNSTDSVANSQQISDQTPSHAAEDSLPRGIQGAFASLWSRYRRTVIIAASALLGISVVTAGILIAVGHHKNTHVTLQGEEMSISQVRSVSYSQLPSAEELEQLLRCTELERLDFTAAPLTDAEFDNLQAHFPRCEIIWHVPFGGTGVRSDCTEVSLGSVPSGEWHMVSRLPLLESVDFSGSEEFDSIKAFAEAHPELDCRWTVPVLDMDCAHDTESIDLSGAMIEDSAALAAQLARLEKLSRADISGCSLSPEQIAELRAALPHCTFTWTYDLYGNTYPGDTAELDLRRSGITDITPLKKLLPYLDSLKKVYLTDLKIPSKDIEKLADAYPNIKFVWRVRFGKWSCLTDARAFSTKNPSPPSYRLASYEAEVLRYCTELEALDLGHNKIRDISFVAHMPQLKVLILADNRVTDLSPLSELKNLEYIELFINPVADISPLAGLDKLQDVNICSTQVRDLSPLMGKPSLKRLWVWNIKVPKEERPFIADDFPGCKVVYLADHSTDEGWRKGERYEWIVDYFGYKKH